MSRIGWAFVAGVLMGRVGVAVARCTAPSLRADLVLLKDPAGTAPPDGTLWADDRGSSFVVAVELLLDGTADGWLRLESAEHPEGGG